MNNGATLVSHSDTARISYEDLARIPAPEATRYWRPVPHVELIDTAREEVQRLGYEITKEQYALGSHGLKMFGTFDMSDTKLGKGIGAALGLRHSNDKHIALNLVGGARVFVCDNMAFSGDAVVLKHKHTWNFSLRDLIRRGLEIWQNKQERMAVDIDRLRCVNIDDEKAQSFMAKSLYDGIVTFQTFKIAYDLYFNRAVRQPDEYSDCSERTVWGLHNAFTRALKESTPNVAFNTTIELGKAFGLGTKATAAIAA